MRDTKPHDTFFTHCFSHKQEVADFLRGRLDKGILDLLDLNTLKQQPNTFLPSWHRPRRKADVLWTVQTKQRKRCAFFFHFEGQSTHDKHMMGRLLEYHAAIVNQFLQTKDPQQQHAHAKCPPIITYVLYHGNQDWTSPRRIADVFEDFDLYLQHGLLANLVLDLPNEPASRMVNDGQAGATELILASQAKKTMVERLDAAYPAFMDKGPCCKEALVRYTFQENQEQEKRIIEKIRRFDPTIAHHYQAMFEQALKKVRQEGIAQGMQQIIQQLLQKGTITQGQADAMLSTSHGNVN